MSVLTENTTTVGADATQRTLRSLFQGAIVVVATAVISVLLPAINSGVDKVDWSVTGYAALTAAGYAFLSYVMAKVLPALNTPGDGGDGPAEPGILDPDPVEPEAVEEANAAAANDDAQARVYPPVD